MLYTAEEVRRSSSGRRCGSSSYIRSLPSLRTSTSADRQS